MKQTAYCSRLCLVAAFALGGCADIQKVLDADEPLEAKIVKIRDIAAEFLGGSQGSRADAIIKYEYSGTGNFLQIESASLMPQLAAPGTTVEALVSYVVLAPEARREVNVLESRTLVGSDNSLLLSRREVVRKQGAQTSTMKFTLPRDIAKGFYTLVTSVSNGTETKTIDATFQVN